MDERAKLNERTIRAIHAILGVIRWREEVLLVTEVEDGECALGISLLAELDPKIARLLGGDGRKPGHVLVVNGRGKYELRNFDKS